MPEHELHTRVCEKVLGYGYTWVDQFLDEPSKWLAGKGHRYMRHSINSTLQLGVLTDDPYTTFAALLHLKLDGFLKDPREFQASIYAMRGYASTPGLDILGGIIEQLWKIYLPLRFYPTRKRDIDVELLRPEVKRAIEELKKIARQYRKDLEESIKKYRMWLEGRIGKRLPGVRIKPEEGLREFKRRLFDFPLDRKCAICGRTFFVNFRAELWLKEFFAERELPALFLEPARVYVDSKYIDFLASTGAPCKPVPITSGHRNPRIFEYGLVVFGICSKCLKKYLGGSLLNFFYDLWNLGSFGQAYKHILPEILRRIPRIRCVKEYIEMTIGEERYLVKDFITQVYLWKALDGKDKDKYEINVSGPPLLTALKDACISEHGLRYWLQASDYGLKRQASTIGRLVERAEGLGFRPVPFIEDVYFAEVPQELAYYWKTDAERLWYEG